MQDLIFFLRIEFFCDHTCHTLVCFLFYSVLPWCCHRKGWSWPLGSLTAPGLGTLDSFCCLNLFPFIDFGDPPLEVLSYMILVPSEIGVLSFIFELVDVLLRIFHLSFLHHQNVSPQPFLLSLVRCQIVVWGIM